MSQEAAYQALPQELLLGPLAKALQVGARPVGCTISSLHPGRLGPRHDSLNRWWLPQATVLLKPCMPQLAFEYNEKAKCLLL